MNCDIQLEKIAEEIVSAKAALKVAGTAQMSADQKEAKMQRKKYDDADLAARTATYKREVLLDKIARKRAEEEIDNLDVTA